MCFVYLEWKATLDRSKKSYIFRVALDIFKLLMALNFSFDIKGNKLLIFCVAFFLPQLLVLQSFS